MEIMRLLRAARWLTTSQIHRRFFADATTHAARQRLRRLARAGYLRKHQESRMREALFTLNWAGKLALERAGTPEIVLERKPPKQLDHLRGINEVRIAAEMTGRIAFFFAAWELPGAGWKHRIIPDAVFRFHDRAFALEFDCGTEGIQFFIRTKIATYRRGLAGLPLAAVLVVADRKARMEALGRAIVDDRGYFLFTTVDAIRERGILAPIFYRNVGGRPDRLIETSSAEVFHRGNRFAAPSVAMAKSYRKKGGAS